MELTSRSSCTLQETVVFGIRCLGYLNNRYHDPTLGQFISVDPLVTSTGLAYSYTSGNPISYSDPLGLEECRYEGGEYVCWSEADMIASTGGGEGHGKAPAHDPSGGGTGAHIPTEELIRSPIEPSAWCGAPPCPTTIGPDHVFDSDAQAAAFLTYTSAIYGFVDAAVNSESLWAHYSTPSGKEAVRWKPGFGWLRTRAGVSASNAVSIGNTLKVGGRGLVVLGGALDAREQWQRDDGYDPGVRLFRSAAVGGASAASTALGGSAGFSASSAFCASTATWSCGGPLGTGAVIGVSTVAGAVIANYLTGVTIQRLL